MDLTPERYSIAGHDLECARAMLAQALRRDVLMPLDEIQVMHLLQIGYRAGREAAARDIKRVAESTRESLVSTPPEYANEAAYHRTRAQAFERAVEIARGSTSTERGSE